MLLKTGARLFRLLAEIVLPGKFPGIWRYVHRLVVLTLLLPVFLSLQLVHWLGFLIDELVFFRYRRVAVRAPWLVLGVPRSGTTFLHRLLASDPSFTTFSTWECLFAPSITERYLWRGIGTIDRWVGRPLHRLTGLLEKKLLAGMEDMHPMSLDAPEEDYLALLPILCCFILVVPFPDADWIWKMGTFDRDVDARERQQLMAWYRRCLQKHLFVNGEEKTLLSKNASFAGMAGSLLEAFPDARLVLCERDALHVIASQFRSIEPGCRTFGYSANDENFRPRLLDCLAFYYENLERVKDTLPENRQVRVALWDLSRNTREVFDTIAQRFDRVLAPETKRAIAAYEGRSAPPGPARSPNLDRWGINTGDARQRFSAWRHQEELRI
jgi:hypothetical protein